MQENMSDYLFYKSKHRCTRCHTRDAVTLSGQALCADCRDERNRKSREKYATDPKRYIKVSMKSYRKRKAEHRCAQCGTDLPEGETRTMCEGCRERHNRRKREADREERMTKRKSPPKQDTIGTL